MKAEPIWHRDAQASHVYIKREFFLGTGIERGWMHCAASGPYQLYLNGELAGRGLGSSLAQRAVWERFELRALLRAGENILLVLCAGSGRDPWFAARGEIAWAGGGLELGTGRPWQVLRAAAWEKDARVFDEEVGWRQGRFSPGAWEEATVRTGVEEPATWESHPSVECEVWAREVAAFGEVEAGGTLEWVAAPGPMAQCKCVHPEAALQAGRSRTRVQTRSGQRAVFLALDFGRPVTGFPRLRLRGRGGVLEMGFARARGKIEHRMHYICGGEGREWTGLHLQCCRYMVLRFSRCEEEVELDCVSLVERRVEGPGHGLFVASPLLEQVWKAAQRTLDRCRQEIYYVPGETTTYDWLRAWALSLDDYYLSGDMRTASCTLAACRSAPEEVAQSLARVLFAEAYYRYSGEAEQVWALLPEFRQLFAECGARKTENGLLPGCGEAWPAAALSALYAGALAAAARLCAGARETGQAGQYRREGDRVRRALQALWTAEQGGFTDEPGGAVSQWSNALVLYFGLARPGRAREIVRHIYEAEIRPLDAAVQAFFLAAGLGRAGAGARFLDYVETQWSRSLESRAEETLRPGPGYLLGAQVLGVRPGAPGYGVLEVRPSMLPLSHARGRIWTRRGAVGVEWRRDELRGGFSMVVELEARGETHLCAPRLGLRFPTLSLNGETLWRNEKFHPNSFVRQVISEEEYIVLVLRGEGRYEAAVE